MLSAMKFYYSLRRAFRRIGSSCRGTNVVLYLGNICACRFISGLALHRPNEPVPDPYRFPTQEEETVREMPLVRKLNVKNLGDLFDRVVQSIVGDFGDHKLFILCCTIISFYFHHLRSTTTY